MTAHWIEVKDEKWKLRSEVVGFQPTLGEHSGENLGRYFVGLCDRVGIMSPKESKVPTIVDFFIITDNTITIVTQLQAVTLDNASNNTTSCETVEYQHSRRNLLWDAGENQLP